MTTIEIKAGDRVEHFRHGIGTVLSVDSKTYSIPFVSVSLDHDKQYPLYVPMSDIAPVATGK